MKLLLNKFPERTLEILSCLMWITCTMSFDSTSQFKFELHIHVLMVKTHFMILTWDISKGHFFNSLLIMITNYSECPFLITTDAVFQNIILITKTGNHCICTRKQKQVCTFENEAPKSSSKNKLNTWVAARWWPAPSWKMNFQQQEILEVL